MIFQNCLKFRISKLRITIFEISLVVFMPNITTNHAITYTNTVPFYISFIFDDIDDQAFVKLFDEVVNEHTPIRQHTRGGQVPYMTPEWRCAIHHRNRLWKKCMTLRTNENLLAYKNLRNLCTLLRRRAIKSYYSTKTDNLSSNPRDFWRVFSPLFKSWGGGTNDIFLQENGLPIGDKQQMANVFNDFFVSVANGME